MDLDQLRLFLAVARAGSFAEAGRRHNIDPSQVSRAIAALEGALGARLFQRSTRMMRLTEAGVRYAAELPPVLAGLDRLREETRGAAAHPEGLVRVTASIAFAECVLMPLLPDFRARFPGIALDLAITDGNLDLVGEGIDIALRHGPSRRADIAGERLFATRYRVVASLGYLAAHGSPDTPEAVAQRDCLLLDLPDHRGRWRFKDRSGREIETQVTGGLRISSVSALRQAARLGLGPALLADWMVDADIAEGRLVDLFPGFAATATTFETAAWLLYPSRDWLPRPVRESLRFLRARLSEQPRTPAPGR